MIEPILGQRESALISADGIILHFTPLKVETACKLRMKDFPFDKQNCPIQFISWIHDTKALALDLSYPPVISDYDGYRVTSDWNILSLTTSFHNLTFSTTNESFTQQMIRFTLSVERKSAFHVAYIVLPSAMLQVIVIVSFLLPIRSGERISLGLTAFLAYSVNMLIIADKLPEASDTIPDIGELFLYYNSVQVRNLEIDAN